MPTSPVIDLEYFLSLTKRQRQELLRANNFCTGYPDNLRAVSAMNPSRRKSKMARLIERDGLVCCWCKRNVVMDGPLYADNRATIEHVMPLSKGGTHGMHNLKIACRKCNNGHVGTKRLEIEGPKNQKGHR